MDKKLKKPSGILRLDIGKPRRSSGGSVEFRNQPEILIQEKTAPTTLISPQLSVSWAFATENETIFNENQSKPRTSNQSSHTPTVKVHTPILEKRRIRRQLFIDTDTLDPNTSINFMEKSGNQPDENEIHESDEEDYSVSVSAIMQRRASTCKGNKKRGYKSPRRASSPMGPFIGIGNFNERRRSSVYTTSSGDTAISFDDGTNQDSTQEQIFENIRLHKEVLQSVKLQPWSMRRKLRLVRQAKEYVAKHEGALQERFAMSRNTKDLLTRFRIVLTTFLLQRLQHLKRELLNISTVLIPWERRIKEIESHFGSVVASYFTFLRWLFWVNIVIAVVLTAFVVTPELLVFDPYSTDIRKSMLPEEKQIAAKLITIWDFEGYLKYSPLFYGYYSDSLVQEKLGYKLPLAYFLTGLVVYIYSFVATLRKMAENSRMSKLSSKDDECVFTWKLFTGWDFMIGHAETAQNRVASVVLGFKEALLEEAEKKKEKRNWKVIALRIFVNFLVLGLLGISAFAVVFVVSRSTDAESQSSWWRRNEITIVMSLISYFFPMFFEALGFMESYHPRQQLRRQLARIMILNLINLYSLIFALFDKITGMTTRMKEIQDILNETMPTTSPTPFAPMSEMMQQAIDAQSSFLDSNSFSDFTTNLFNGFSSFDTTINPDIIPYNNGCIFIPIECEEDNNINGTVIATLAVIKLAVDLLTKNYTNNSDNLSIFFPYLENITNFTIPNFNLTNDFVMDFNRTINNWNFTDDEDNINNNDTDFSNTTSSLNLEQTRTKRQLIRDFLHNTNYDDNFQFYNFISKLNSDYNEYDDEFEDDNDDGNENPNSESNSSSSQNLIDSEDSVENLTLRTTTMENTWLDEINSTESSTVTYTTNSIIPNINTESNVDSKIQTTQSNPSDISMDNFKDILKEVIQILKEQVPEKETQKQCYNISCPETTTVDFDYSTLPIDEFKLNDITPRTNQKNIETTLSTDVKFTTMSPENTSLTEYLNRQALINATLKRKKAEKQLRKLCWETMFGQELVKLTVMDLVITITSILVLDFFRALFVRFMNRFWCWDLEKKYPKYGDFKIAENILHLVNNQGMVWMGMFFSPGLAVINLVKLVIILYMRSWAVLTCNVPHEVVFRASRSNNFYLALLLTMLFLCVLPVAFAIVWLQPSWHCGPFSENERIYHLFTDTIKEALPSYFHKPLEYIASPSTVIPLLVLLVLIIYYLVSLTNALREANQDLKLQLRRERTEERRKMFKIVENNPTGDPTQNAPNSISARWKKVLENSNSPLTPTGAAGPDLDEEKAQARKELLARIMKKALRKGSATSEDDSNLLPIDDGTDTDQHESLPHDQDTKKGKKKRKSKSSDKSKKKGGSWLALIRTASQTEKVEQPDLNEEKGVEKRKSNDEKKEGKHKKCFPVKTSQDRERLIHSKKALPTILPSVPAQEKFEIINEKTPKNTEPQVFCFDEAMLQLKLEREAKKEEEAAKSKQPADEEYLSDDMSTYREINFVNLANEKLEKAEKAAEKVEEAPIPTPPPHTGNKFANLIMNKLTSVSSDPKIESSEQQQKENEKKSSTWNKDTQRSKKKLNSFLALVREAVQNKKTEPDSPIDPDNQHQQKAQTSASAAVAAQSSSSPLVSSSKPKPNQQSESRKNSKKNCPSDKVTKRQDSSSSIWSENIPVITISKTESDECILEDEKSAHKYKKKRNNSKEKNEPI